MQKGQVTFKELKIWCKDKKLNILEENLIISEGFVPQFYYDSKNILTFGVGHNCKAGGLSYKEFIIASRGSIEQRMRLSFSILHNDTTSVKRQIDNFFSEISLSSSQRYALIEMVFHMGFTSFRGFEKMIKAIKRGYWTEAIKEGKDSRWYRDFPERAEKVLRGFES